MSEATEVPVLGVVMVFIDDQGRVICEATDFERHGYGGFTLKEAQRIRCKDALSRLVVSAYASPALTRAINQHRADDILRDLVREHKCMVRTIYVGHDEKNESGEP